MNDSTSEKVNHQTDAVSGVGQVPHACMTEDEAPSVIERAEAAVRTQELRYERSGCFGDAADLDRARRLLSQLLLRWRRNG
jgi:hypothetical protein